MAGAGNPQGVQQPQSPVAGNVAQTSANLFNQASAGPNIGQFMNPYTSEVIGRTGMDMARQAEMQRNTLGAQATQAGAFGGSRHGVAEGTMMGDFGRSFGDIAAQQRQQGFNTALQAAQNQQNIQSGLAGQGFGFGQQINQQQFQQGQAQQLLNQALIDAAKGQYGGFTGAPAASLNLPLTALGAGNMGQKTETVTSKPGLFEYLSAGLTGLSGLK
jgi:hypothetical protein